MGRLNVKKLTKNEDKTKYIEQLLLDIEALEKMLEDGRFNKGPIHIGAEQEFCLTDSQWNPSAKAQEILKDINDPHFTSELTLYNLEINLDPFELKGNCFSELHKKLNYFLDIAKDEAAKYDSKVVLTGILPTIDTPNLELEFMTPLERYKVLNEAINDIRSDDFELHIKGVDEVNLHHNSILYEGCNTSFQSHLQIDPDKFADTYNWAQAIAGPILSICTNSPLLMGQELWEETRIALFTQSVDTRASTFILNEKESRVSFGNDWVKGSAADFYKDAVIRFRSLLTTDFEEDSMTLLKDGKTPNLDALILHNGTIYKWNRLCYGVNDGVPHLRIENRYLPSGPTTDDEIANMMLWVGVMIGKPKKFEDIHTKMEFKDAKGNFFNAARYGMAAQFHWDEKLINSHDLLMKELLPMAYRGLYSIGVTPKDAEHYLSIIENRIQSQNGSRWITKAFRKLKKSYRVADALKILVATMYERQGKHYTVDAWQLPRGDEYVISYDSLKVKDRMNTKTITAMENDSAELVLKMMLWKNIHHAPILDVNLDLCGILTWTDVENDLKDEKQLKKSISSLMKTDLITTSPETSLKDAKELMQSHKINSLPVVKGKKLIGIITSNDF
ncbi:MAG: CBS domain-containing protein [Eudoraea sp.]|uniref:CBS domain-containing protein n=1 Tax=Eudoraea sp. TaxID=1979955 RepID=UPI003C75555B